MNSVSRRPRLCVWVDLHVRTLSALNYVRVLSFPCNGLPMAGFLLPFHPHCHHKVLWQPASIIRCSWHFPWKPNCKIVVLRWHPFFRLQPLITCQPTLCARRTFIDGFIQITGFSCTRRNMIRKYSLRTRKTVLVRKKYKLFPSFFYKCRCKRHLLPPGTLYPGVHHA